MNGLRRVISNTIISFLGQGVNWISTILLTIAYGHFLGAFKFGELILAIAFVSLIGVPVSYGYDSQAIRDVAQKPDKGAGHGCGAGARISHQWSMASSLALPPGRSRFCY